MSRSITSAKQLVGLISWTVLGACFSCSACGQSSHVLTEEVREFEILVKERPAGTKTIRITDTDNGLTTVSTEANVDLNYVLYSYHYEFHGQEVWQGNRLVSVENHAIDGGTQLTTRARINSSGSTIENSGKSAVLGPVLSITTNYWRAPEGSKRGELKLLDADQGTVHTDQIIDITSEQIVIGGHPIDCTHYHLGNELVADLWFDSQHRLVQQRSIEDGYPVQIRLTRITTNPMQHTSP
jgi:hypothetical protein